MDKIRILLADDDTVFCRLVNDLLSRQGYLLTVANSSEFAREQLASINFDILMLDMCYPSLTDGFTLLEDARRLYPKLEILMISGSGHIPDAVRAIKLGASDFIEKPIEPEHLLLRIKNLGERLLRERRIYYMARTITRFTGTSAAIKHVVDSIITAARFDTPVLITGETGVGKELAANAIHSLSALGDKPMVRINCASIPKDLFEAELFGYEKGAFTGAVKSHRGFFEFAKDTSIFLDEISELPLSVQAKLLRVISEHEMQKVGGKVIKINSRVISASNQDLKARVKAGGFREDLFYRLNAVTIEIPPLRTRKADIPLLAKVFLDDFCNSNQIKSKHISSELLAWLSAQPWKGNARELKNCIERAVIFSKGDTLDVVDFTTLPCHQGPAQGDIVPLRETMTSFERQLIRHHLEANNYNITRTAQRLGLDKSNLSKRIRALGIDLKGSG